MIRTRYATFLPSFVVLESDPPESNPKDENLSVNVAPCERLKTLLLNFAQGSSKRVPLFNSTFTLWHSRYHSMESCLGAARREDFQVRRGKPY